MVAHNTPKLSVVIVAFNTPELLQRCIRSLVDQADFSCMEVHVVSKSAAGDESGDSRHFANIHWHGVPSELTVPQMRSLGISKSNAKLVALLEDDCAVNTHWFAAIRSGHDSARIAVGGAIEPGAYTRGLDWGVYYCEYARFLAPLQGEVRALPGNNVAYKKAALDPSTMVEGFYEEFTHSRWRDAGLPLYAAAGMEVRNDNRWQISNCTWTPFNHGRAYAAQRFGSGNTPRRLLFGFLSVFLPVLKSARTIREIISRKRAELPIFKALPWIVLFHCCWSAGECVGYLLGPGQSISRWR